MPPSSGPPIAAADRHWYPAAVAEKAGWDTYGPASMRAVARLNDGFIAVGSGPSGGIDWTSPDGRSWHRTEFPSKVLRNADLVALAVGTDQIVAAGSISSLNGPSRPALWATGAGGGWSLVGGSWSLVADPVRETAPANTATGDGRMVGVVATPGGFVAVGEIDQHAYAWRSTGGLTWKRYDLTSSEVSDLKQLIAGPGGLLATGETFGSFGWRATTWRSTDDGRTWSEATFPTAHLDTLTADANAYWAFGWDAGPNGTDRQPDDVLRSTDGAQWRKVGMLPTGAATGAIAIATGSGDTVVVGIAGKASGSGSAVFASHDGQTWTKEATTGTAAADPRSSAAIIATDASIIVVGERTDRPAAWIAVPAGVAPPPATQAPVVHPAGWCPPGAVDLPAILSLSQPDRLRCFGSRTIKFPAFVVEPGGVGGTCGCLATPTWLTGGGVGLPAAWLAPLDAPFGRITTLPAFARPSLRGTTPTLRWVTVTGHFSDPASLTCRIRGLDGALLVPVTRSIARCRQSFVATGITTIQPPDPTSDLRIADPYVIEPSDAGIDGVSPLVVAFGLADLWRGGIPVASILVFRTALTPAATRSFTARLAKENDATARRSILGVSVAFSPDGTRAVFDLGHRTFLVSGDGSPGALTPAEIHEITTALIRANR